MTRIVITIVLLGSASFGACNRPSDQGRAGHGQTHTVADVVARAGDLSIGASEVRTLMATDNLSAEASLQQLIGEALMVQEAERIGLAADPEAERGVERLMVRAMLHDLEKQNTPESISDAEVRADYARHTDAHQGTIDEAEKDIRSRLSQEKRLRKVVEIVQRLEAQGLVHYDKRGVERLLSMSGLPERGE